MRSFQVCDVDGAFSQLNMDCDEVTQLYDARFQKDIEEKCALMSHYQKDIEDKCALVSQYQKDIEEKGALRVSDKLNMPTTRTSVISIALVKCSSSVLYFLRIPNIVLLSPIKFCSSVSHSYSTHIHQIV